VKPISQLISECCNVEDAAVDWTSSKNPECDTAEYWFNCQCSAFKAGAAHVASKLGPALREAIAHLPEWVNEFPGDDTLVIDNPVLDKIRAILEGGE
jgi:hypothetical protein